MSKADELRTVLKVNIAAGDVSKKTIERMKADIIAAVLEEDESSIPIGKRVFARAA